jgi:hypothetical protein
MSDEVEDYSSKVPNHQYTPDPASKVGNCICGAPEQHRGHPHDFMKSFDRLELCTCALPKQARVHTDHWIPLLGADVKSGDFVRINDSLGVLKIVNIFRNSWLRVSTVNFMTQTEGFFWLEIDDKASLTVLVSRVDDENQFEPYVGKDMSWEKILRKEEE